MAPRDPRVDTYIEKSADFSKPILTHIRETVHFAAPLAEETIKWGFPHFMYGGTILCSMAGFKELCAIHFWKGDLVVGQKRAVKLNEERAKAPKVPKPRQSKPELATPAPLLAALKKNRKAKVTFDSLSPSHRREYVEWISEAKTDATRDKRIATTTEWLTEGKSRNWKYERT